MRVVRLASGFSLQFTGAEMRAFHNELLDVRGGAKMPKLKQVCEELRKAHLLTSGELDEKYKTVRKKNKPRTSKEVP